MFKCCVCPSNLEHSVEGLQQQLLVLCHDSVNICSDSESVRSYRRASKCSYYSYSPVRCNTDMALKQKSKEMQIRSLGKMRGHTNEMWILLTNLRNFALLFIWKFIRFLTALWFRGSRIVRIWTEIIEIYIYFIFFTFLKKCLLMERRGWRPTPLGRKRKFKKYHRK